MNQEGFPHEELNINNITIQEMSQASTWLIAKWAEQMICAVNSEKQEVTN